MLWAPLAGAAEGDPREAHRREGDELLAIKAESFREALVTRHLAPEGLLLYRIDLETIGADLENGSYPNLADGPVFTGIWAATSCVRGRVEPPGPDRSEALADAKHALGGLRRLMDVTGRPGLMARSFRTAKSPPVEGRGRWFEGVGDHADYRWRGDVSIDQYASGLLPALAECRPSFPDRTRALVTDFADLLLENDFRLIDPDGRPTRYGDLSWRSGFGFNSIAQLTAYAGMSLAAEQDPNDPRWAEAQAMLRDRYRVVARGRVTNLRVLGVTNHSNDLMAWNLYRALVPLARHTGDPALPDLRHGMRRAWLRVRQDGNAYFAALSCWIEPATCDCEALEDARTLLVRFPLEKRKLAPHPALDVLARHPIPGRKGKRLARDPVPIELRPPSSFEWKSSPYRLEGGTSPRQEYTGLDFLAAYWLLRGVEQRGICRAPWSSGGE